MKYLRGLIPLFLILIGISIFYLLGWDDYISFRSLKEHHDMLKTTLREHPFFSPILFMLFYALFVALCIPGAIFLAILGGYLFPQPFSTIYVVIAETCGATVIFLATRMAFKTLFKAQVRPFLKKFKEGFQQNAPSYMLFLRFVPIFPFWVVNIAPSFLGLSTKTFIWTTCVGIIPGSYIFTLAGQGLEKIIINNLSFSKEAIMITEMKIALAVLGFLALLPIFLKKLKKRR